MLECRNLELTIGIAKAHQLFGLDDLEVRAVMGIDELGSDNQYQVGSSFPRIGGRPGMAVVEVGFDPTSTLTHMVGRRYPVILISSVIRCCLGVLVSDVRCRV